MTERKRSTLNIRTTGVIKERLQRAATSSGRTMSQEADFRLAWSLLLTDMMEMSNADAI